MIRRSVVLFGLLSILVSSKSFAQEAKFQSIFMYNFTRYIKWPDAMMSGNFVIGVYGGSDVYDELQKMAEAKGETQGLAMVIEKYNTVNEIKKCHILFVSKDKVNELQQIGTISSLNSTLIVTDSPGQAKKGSTINFVEVDGRIKFALNQDNAAKRNLKVSSSLTSLAILV